MKKLTSLVLFFFFPLCFGHFVYKIRDGYNTRKISHFTTLSPSELSEQEHKILTQKFTYLSRGRQCFVFASQDGQYVLKIPRTDHINTSLASKIFPFIFKKDQLQRKKEEQHILKSLNIAKSLLAEETATLAVHQGIKTTKNILLTLQDPLGFYHTIDPQNICFILQRKVPLWTDAFHQAKQSNNVKEKEQLLSSLLTFFSHRAKKGISNSDNTFEKNFGFENAITYQIDIADFHSETSSKDPANTLRRFQDGYSMARRWVEKNDPKMVPFLEKQKSIFLENIEQ